MTVTLHTGDCLEYMATMDANSVDSIVTDPPYGLSKEPDIAEVLTHWLAGDTYTHNGGGFMGKTWDSFVPGPEYWRACYRVLKPGGYLLCFASTRTFDLMAIALRLAGFEQHPFISWIFASGFPKATNLSKQLDRMAGAERASVGVRRVGVSSTGRTAKDNFMQTPTEESKWKTITAPATPEAQQWDGWFYGKQSLKPAMEPILMFQKPFEKGLNGAANVLAWGTGAVNVDGCRVGMDADDRKNTERNGVYGATNSSAFQSGKQMRSPISPQGRWPANVILSYPEDEYDADGNVLPNPGRDEVLAGFPVTTSGSGIKGKRTQVSTYGKPTQDLTTDWQGDTGSAARYFYCAKASKRDRDEGLEGMALRDGSVGDNRPSGSMSQRVHKDEGRPDTLRRNFHPTVKPTELMKYLCRLVTPPGGVVFDPFMGSGSTGKAARLEGFDFIGCDLEAEYVEIARRRIEAAQVTQPLLLAAD